MTSFGSGEKRVIYRLDIIFSITHLVQFMVSEINLFCQRNICRYPEKACQKVEKWQWLIISMWHLVEISEETTVYAYGNASNFKLEEPRCFFLVLAFVSSKGKLKQIVIHFPYETSNDIIQCYQFSRRILPLITPNGD